LYSTWIGGSILAGLSTFRKMYVSIDDWHESEYRGSQFGVGVGMVLTFGADPDIIHQKFA